MPTKLTREHLDPELRAIASTDHPFMNWAKTFCCVPELYFEPTTEEEVVKIIMLAKKYGKTVKAVGAGHSPSDICCVDGFMINTSRLNNVLDVDNKSYIITVQAGISLSDLHLHLQENGLAMSNLGSISDQTLAGAISTATHGTGINYRCMSSSVLAVTIIRANGEPVHCSCTHNSDIFYAALCGLGALGIITRIQLQAEPAFRLEARQMPTKLTSILNNLTDVVHSAEHVRFWWFPHTEDCVVWRANRSTLPKRPSESNWFKDRFLGYHMYQFFLFLSRYAPNMIPALTRTAYSTLMATPVHVVDDSWKVFNFDCLFPQYVNEWAVPLERTTEAICKLKTFIDTKELKVHFPVEVRFVDADDIWLSPAYGRKVCYIGVIMYRPYGLPVPYKKYWEGYEDIMRSVEGRPHWAKAHGMSRNELRARYPKFDDFLKVRERLDPDGMFLNDYLRKHIIEQKAFQAKL